MSVSWNKRKYTKEEFTVAWESSDSVKECARKLGLNPAGGFSKSLKIAANELNLTVGHMRNNPKYGPRNPRSLTEILVEYSTHNGPDLRVRLLKEGLLEARCSAPYCPNPEEYPNPFTGEMVPQKLTLDHINGVNTDNRIENLRILCYNCHALTDTFCGKNRKNRLEDRFCNCGEKLTGKNSKRCMPCHLKNKSSETIFGDYSIETLIEGVQTFGWLPYAKSLGSTDNTLRKEFTRRGYNCKLYKKSTPGGD